MQNETTIPGQSFQRTRRAALAVSFAEMSRRTVAVFREFVLRYQEDIWLSAVTLVLLAGFFNAIWRVH